MLFRSVTPGRGYRIRQGSHRSAPLTVFSDRSAAAEHPHLRQRIPTSGYGYLTTRDGTRLAIDVHLPGGAGPYPTLVEYAGYGYADPKGPDSGIAAVANLLGFAVVDVNMRGTGCSGGAYDYFEPLQSLDGYDIVETVAHQPWVLHHRVGMMGISYGGISQMFVGATDPPHLAAIAPLSVIDNTATTLYAGGHPQHRVRAELERGARPRRAAGVPDRRPALGAGPDQGRGLGLPGQPGPARRGGQPDRQGPRQRPLRARHRRPAGPDHLRAQDPRADVRRLPVDRRADRRPLRRSGPALHRHPAQVWFTFTNGTHIDSLDPDTFNRWYDFLELYVARRAPALSPAVRAEAPLVYSTAMGVPGITLPADPIQSAGSYSAALAAFQRAAPDPGPL